MKVNKLPILLRILLSVVGCLTALVFPIILYYICGLKNSLSLYVGDLEGREIFNYSLLIISISLMVRKIYLFPASLVLLIIYFDVITYPVLHNFIAGVFFLLLGVTLLLEKKYIYTFIMVSNILVLVNFGLYFFELVAIFLVVLYNLEITYRVLRKEYLESSLVL